MMNILQQQALIFEKQVKKLHTQIRGHVELTGEDPLTKKAISKKYCRQLDSSGITLPHSHPLFDVGDVPPLKPESLVEEQILEVLDSAGGLPSVTQKIRLVKDIMFRERLDLQKVPFFCAILTCTVKKEALKYFFEIEGLKIFKVWIIECVRRSHYALLEFVFECLKSLPLTYDQLRDSDIVKVLKKLKQQSPPLQAKVINMIEQLIEHWKEAFKSYVAKTQEQKGVNVPPSIERNRFQLKPTNGNQKTVEIIKINKSTPTIDIPAKKPAMSVSQLLKSNPDPFSNKTTSKNILDAAKRNNKRTLLGDDDKSTNLKKPKIEVYENLAESKKTSGINRAVQQQQRSNLTNKIQLKSEPKNEVELSKNNLIQKVDTADYSKRSANTNQLSNKSLGILSDQSQPIEDSKSQLDYEQQKNIGSTDQESGNDTNNDESIDQNQFNSYDDLENLPEITSFAVHELTSSLERRERTRKISWADDLGQQLLFIKEFKMTEAVDGSKIIEEEIPQTVESETNNENEDDHTRRVNLELQLEKDIFRNAKETLQKQKQEEFDQVKSALEQMKAKTQWRVPQKLKKFTPEDATVVSEQVTIQNRRTKGSMETQYFFQKDIPNSPALPLTLNATGVVEQESKAPIEIPLFDPTQMIEVKAEQFSGINKKYGNDYDRRKSRRNSRWGAESGQSFDYPPSRLSQLPQNPPSVLSRDTINIQQGRERKQSRFTARDTDIVPAPLANLDPQTLKLLTDKPEMLKEILFPNGEVNQVKLQALVDSIDRKPRHPPRDLGDNNHPAVPPNLNAPRFPAPAPNAYQPVIYQQDITGSFGKEPELVSPQQSLNKSRHPNRLDHDRERRDWDRDRDRIDWERNRDRPDWDRGRDWDRDIDRERDRNRDRLDWNRDRNRDHRDRERPEWDRFDRDREHDRRDWDRDREHEINREIGQNPPSYRPGLPPFEISDLPKNEPRSFSQRNNYHPPSQPHRPYNPIPYSHLDPLPPMHDSNYHRPPHIDGPPRSSYDQELEYSDHKSRGYPPKNDQLLPPLSMKMQNPKQGGFGHPVMTALHHNSSNESYSENIYDMNDNNSQFSKDRMCHFFNSPQGCRRGDVCPFIHDPNYIHIGQATGNERSTRRSGKKQDV